MNRVSRLTLLAAALTLTACGTASLKAPEGAPAETRITGRVQSWSGSGTVVLQGNVRPLAATSVSGDGSFSLTLPSADALLGETRGVPEAVVRGLAQLNCQDAGLVNANSSARGLLTFALAATDASGPREVFAAQVSRGAVSRKVDARAWLYLDAPTSLTGKVSCSVPGVGTFPVQVDVQAVPGWNLLALTLNASVGFGGLSVSGTAVRTQVPVETWITMNELNQALR